MSNKHNVNRRTEVEFADGVERNLKPLTIRQLRQFVPLVEKMSTTSNAAAMSDDDIDLMVQASKIILERVDKVLADDDEAIEDAVDMFVFPKMMDVAMGAAAPNV